MAKSWICFCGLFLLGLALIASRASQQHFPVDDFDALYRSVEQVIGNNRAQSQELGRQIQRHLAFQKALDAILSRMDNRSITVAEAAREIHQVAMQSYPEYLKLLEKHETGTTAEERVLHNLQRYVHSHDGSIAQSPESASPRKHRFWKHRKPAC